jgi:hypothetical protein
MKGARRERKREEREGFQPSLGSRLSAGANTGVKARHLEELRELSRLEFLQVRNRLPPAGRGSGRPLGPLAEAALGLAAEDEMLWGFV